MAIPTVLSETNWKNQGLTLRSTFEKIKKQQTGVSGALRSLAAADHLPAWDVAPKHQAYTAVHNSLVAAENTHTNNAALKTLLTQMKNALPQVKQSWQHAIDAIDLNLIFGTAQLYNVFHGWAVSQHIQESVEFIRDYKAHVSPATLYATYIPNGSPKEINIDDSIRVAIAQAPGHNAPAAFADAYVEVERMMNGGRIAGFKTHLKGQL